MLQINKRKVVVSVAIGYMAGICDKNSMGQEDRLSAAIVDNFSHAAIGFLTWLGVLCAEPSFKIKSHILEFLLCAIVSSIIDLDHFIEAKSFSLKDAVSISNRPFMHCTSTTLSAIIVILCFAYKLNIFWLYQFGWILIAAVVSHHVRDSSRRGFWLWPFGSTPPTQYGLYIIIQMLLPYAISFLMNQFPMTNVQNVSDALFSVV